MYINDTHIGFFIGAAILGLFVGQLIEWISKRLPENKKIISRDIFRTLKIQFKPKYILMLLTSAIYVGLIYFIGIQKSLIGNLELIEYLLLVPMLLSAFIIDYKSKIIPNRLNLTMFEVGIVIAFLYGFSNVAITIDLLFGMILGGGIFLIIALISRLIYGKEAMGVGDVKFMAALGVYFGFTNTLIISLIAFLVGAIVGIVLVIFRIKKANEYIPFGPFIVIATFMCMFIPTDFIISTLQKVVTLGVF